MDSSIELLERGSLSDFRAYLLRAVRLQCGSVRVHAEGATLGLWVPVLTPLGLLDHAPTVLGARMSRLAHPVVVDAVLPIEELLAAVHMAEQRATAEGSARLELPSGRVAVAWTGIAPPRGDWQPLPDVAAENAQRVAEQGIAEVAAAVPDALGISLVGRVRSEVWGRPSAELGEAPAGAAFALFGLGFLAAGQPVRRFRSGLWQRFSTPAGHVLVRHRPH